MLYKIILKTSLFLLILLAISGCSFEPEVESDQNVWDYAAPSSVGLDEGVLFNLDGAIKNGGFGTINSLIIIKDDKLIYENYYNAGHTRKTGQTLNALTISIASAMVGVALEAGAITSIDDPIAQYLPEYGDVFLLDPEKSNITINHLMTMRAGFAWNENITAFNDPANNAFQMSQSSDWVRYILERQRDAPAGLRFSFNSGTAVIIAKILENTTGIPFEEYIQSFLFDPLDIKSAQWSFTNEGLPNAAWGLQLNSIDLTKIGYFYLNNGRWSGQQIIPESWIQESTSLQVQISNFSDFGRHWWRYSQFNSIQNLLQQNDIYFGNGFGGQYLYMIPHRNMVVSLTTSNFSGAGFEGFVILRDGILPAIQ